ENNREPSRSSGSDREKSDQKYTKSNLWCTIMLCCNANRDCFKEYHENEDIHLDGIK
ncbi:13216_t:CDS:1, partial [Entrophospora sp. SA101]